MLLGYGSVWGGLSHESMRLNYTKFGQKSMQELLQVKVGALFLYR